MQPLVSIIIPTYNRAHLLWETLDSIVAQTYDHWECIVIDDGSTDGTSNIVTVYNTKDHRFKFHSRPKSMPKGANSCRNYGFELSKGELIHWFDSDDIMHPKCLETKIELFNKNEELGFVVSKYESFTNDIVKTVIEPNFLRNINRDLNAENFITQEVFWATIDFMSRRKICKNVSFNNELLSGQEYNYFSKILVFENPNGAFINETLAFRRIHANSIQNKQAKNKKEYIANKYKAYFYTFLEVHSKHSNKKINLFLINKSIRYSFQLASKRMVIPKLYMLIRTIYKEKGFIITSRFVIIIFIAYLTKKGTSFIQPIVSNLGNEET